MREADTIRSFSPIYYSCILPIRWHHSFRHSWPIPLWVTNMCESLWASTALVRALFLAQKAHRKFESTNGSLSTNSNSTSWLKYSGCWRIFPPLLQFNQVRKVWFGSQSLLSSTENEENNADQSNPSRSGNGLCGPGKRQSKTDGPEKSSMF